MTLNSRLKGATAALVLAAALTASAAHATTVFDASGGDDAFLPTFTGPHNADLDVRSARVSYDAQNIRLTGRMAGDIGTTANSFYVWGVDRGQGTPFLFRPTTDEHPIGEHVLFDAAVVLSLDANQPSGILYLGADGKPTGFTAFDHPVFTISGDTIDALISREDLFSTGFDIADYRYNLWPRFGGLTDGFQVADFAPNDSSFTATTAVPEPASWAMMIMGFGVIGSAMRRRRVALAV
jgi:hypothetical protein